LTGITREDDEKPVQVSAFLEKNGVTALFFGSTGVSPCHSHDRSKIKGIGRRLVREHYNPPV
jgi:hypothetical protein